MSEERSVKLRFFDKAVADKCVALAHKLGLDPAVAGDEESGVWNFVTEPLKPAQRREFISKWANISMERINDSL